MTWTAIVPLKRGAERKTRLAGRLSPLERAMLSDRMALHVIACLQACSAIERVVCLAPSGIGHVELWPDEGRGLNIELGHARARLGTGAMLVIHGDLPLLGSDDIDQLVESAAGGIAIAPDRHGTGTNAVAIDADVPFSFHFGADSFAAHRQAAGGDLRIVRRVGLGLDIDTPEDLDAAINAGFAMKAR